MKKILILSYLIPLIFIYSSILFANFKADKHKNNQIDLNNILRQCADYCEKLDNSILFFVCKEYIQEEIFQLYTKSAVFNNAIFRTNQPRRIENNDYVYDYQLIRKRGKIKERRIMLKENGKKKYVKDASLKTKLFQYKNVVFGPIGLLSHSAQDRHYYKIIRDGKHKSEECIIIEAIPKQKDAAEHLFGKIWLKKDDSSILRIEWEQESLGNYKLIQETAQKLRAKPNIILVSEYDYERNGIRFPSRYSVKEIYISKGRGRRFVRSKLNVVYKDYKFFTVETEVKY